MLPSALAFASLALGSPLVLVREDDRWSAIAELAADRGISALPVPLLTRSERVPRATRSARGVGVAIYAGSDRGLAVDRVDVRAIEHPVSHQVLVVDGKLALVGPPELATSIVRPQSDVELLPELARRDLNTIRGGAIEIVPPAAGAGLSLVAIAGESSDRASIRTGERTLQSSGAFLLPFEHAKPVRIEIVEGELDQLFFASLTALDASSAKPLAMRSAHERRARSTGGSRRHGEGRDWPALEVDAEGTAIEEISAARPLTVDADEWLELWFESPATASDGRTITLLVTVDSRARSVDAKNASAPREGKAASPLFRERTRESGLQFVHMEGPDEQIDIRPTMGPGLALGDIDGDGWVDVFFVQGGGRDKSRTPTSRMYKNDGDGTFTDVTRESGLALAGRGMGALFFDVEGDRDLDLFVANYGTNVLLLNDGRGHFVRAPASAQSPTDRWHAAVSAADYDRDGDLDLYVTSYLRFDRSQMPPSDELARYQREDPVEMLPFAFPGETKSLLRNDTPAGASAPDQLRLRDVAVELGLDDPLGRGMQALFWDFDRDGDQDLYLANDVSPNRLWRNEGDGTFKDIGFTTGMDDPRGSMGLAAADVDADGDEDMLVTNWELEANALYVNNLVSHDSSKHRVATFRDAAVRSGLAQLSVGVTKWGVELFDADLDGDLDLFYANGYTSPDYESTGICVGQPCHYFENDGSGRFKAAFERAGPDLAIPLASRASSACDFDQDGDLDLFVTANNGRARLLENTSPGRAWICVRLSGRGRNPYAIGAEVTLRAGDRTWRQSMRAGTSYLAGNAPELFFGLGDAERIDECTVRWPSGQETKHEMASLRAFVTLTEPEPAAKSR